MYYFLVDVPIDEDMNDPWIEAKEPELCRILAFERATLLPGVKLQFHVNPSWVHVDYLQVNNVANGRLCSQRFIDVLTNESISFIAYPAELLDVTTEQPLAANYWFWLPQSIEGAIDWEGSKIWIDPQLRQRHLSKLILTDPVEAEGPLLFSAKTASASAIHYIKMGSRNYKQHKEGRKHMLPSITVLTSQHIKLEELKDVLIQAGGISHSDPGSVDFGGIVHGDAYITLLVDQDEWHESTTRFLTLLQIDQPDVLEEVRAKLGGEPRITFELEIGRSPASQQLAIDFAIRLTERWPCVFVDLPPPRGVVISRVELFQLHKEGKGLTIDETGRDET